MNQPHTNSSSNWHFLWYLFVYLSFLALGFAGLFSKPLLLWASVLLAFAGSILAWRSDSVKFGKVWIVETLEIILYALIPIVFLLSFRLSFGWIFAILILTLNAISLNKISYRKNKNKIEAANRIDRANRVEK